MDLHQNVTAALILANGFALELLEAAGRANIEDLPNLLELVRCYNAVALLVHE